MELAVPIGLILLNGSRDLVGAEKLSGEDDGDFHTLAGFVLHHRGRIPVEADHFEIAGLRFEIVGMDRNRIDKLIVAPLPKTD